MGGMIDMIYNGTATVEAWSHQGAGMLVYGPMRQIPCRIMGRTTRAARHERRGIQESVGRFVMFCDLEEADRIPLHSRVTSGGRSYEVMEVQAVQGFFGEHTEVGLR